MPSARTVRFETGEGPRARTVMPKRLGALKPEQVLGQLAPVLETVGRVKAALAPDKTLIGFCGSPWTVATYMIGGRGSPDQAAARLFALQQPEAFAQLIDILVEASIAYLVAQFRAGADVVQLFESWALNLDERRVRGARDRAQRADRRRRARARSPMRRSSAFRVAPPRMLAALRRGDRRQCARPRLQRCRRLSPTAHLPTALCRSRATSIRCAWSPAARRWKRAARGIIAAFAESAAYLQSRPRHRARNADRACRAADRDREREAKRWNGSRRCT